MNFKTQLTGLNDFLTEIYKTETRLSTLLSNLGFDKGQIELLRDHHLESVVENFITVIKERLSNRLFDVVSRRFGLDGKPPDTLQAIGDKLGVSRERIRQLEHQAIKRCSYKGTLQIFSNRLHEIALTQLGTVIEHPTPNHVIDKLNRLAEIRATIKAARADYETKRAEIIKTVQAELDALETEYAPLLQEPQGVISNLETEIKNDVLLNGATIQRSKYKAVYMQGRVTWDTKGITKYAETNPEVLKFKKQCQPSVSIRTVRSRASLLEVRSIAETPEKTEPTKAYDIKKIRQEYPKAYERWSPDEDAHLKQQYASGLSLLELAKFFERNKGAIRSRLKKLGVMD